MLGTWCIDPDGNLVEISYDTVDGKPVEKNRELMDARQSVNKAEESIRAIDTELRGQLTAWICCTSPSIEIIIDPMEKNDEGYVINGLKGGVYNNYHCKNCGKKWVELVQGGGTGYASRSSIWEKEIEDYHKGYIEKPKMRCPECHSAAFYIAIVNHDKQRHHYVIECGNCRWKSDRIEHSHGYLEKKDAGTGNTGTGNGESR